MRNKYFALAVALASVVGFAPAAKADCPENAEYYYCGAPCTGGTAGNVCYHRTIAGLFNKCPERSSKSCGAAPKPAKIEKLVSAEEVNTLISCELVAAKNRTAGGKNKTIDLSTAKPIYESLIFNLVSNKGYGGDVSFGIPVFSGASIGPSLSVSDSTSNTSQITNTFKIPDLNELKPNCTGKAAADWLEYVIIKPDLGQEVTQVSVGLEFFVTKDNSDKLSINIFALKLGPQFTSSSSNSQKVCLTFNLPAAEAESGKTPPADAARQATCQISSGGNQSSSGQK